MAHTIVAGLDDSVPGRAAVDWAAERAVVSGGRLTLVHVLEVGLAIPTSVGDELRAAAATLLHDAQQRLAARLPSLHVQAELREGALTGTLCAAARGADLLVVGSHRTGFIRGRSIGSRSLQIAAASAVPVAVVPSSAQRSRFGIVTGVAPWPQGSAVLRFAAHEAEQSEQPLTLIRAWDAPHLAGVRSKSDEPAGELERYCAADAQRVLEAAERELRREFPWVAMHCRRVRRDTIDALLDSSLSASLLVLGGSEDSAGHGSIGGVGHDVLVNLVGPTVIVPTATSAAPRLAA